MAIIREAIPEEVPVITGFQLKMAMETENLILNHETVSRGVAAVFNNQRLGRYYVAEVNANICGSLLTTPEWSDWRNAQVLWIQSVYILPEFRNTGIFKKMYTHLKALVEESEEFAGLRLYVDKSNVSARKVYRQLGMNGDHYELFEWMKPLK